MACVLRNNTKTINNLPENILLEIFQYLSIKELCMIGRVCRAWRRVVRDNSLWRHVNLIPYRLNLHKMWRVIRSHFSAVLLSLHFQGYLHPEVKNWNKPSVSDAMLRDLQERCPNLQHLEMVHVSLTGVSSANLPTSLHSLSITHSRLPTRWFHAAIKADRLKNLTHLDLSLSTMTSKTDINDIIKLTGLTSLKINGCYRVKMDGLRALAGALVKMTHLEVGGTGCTDLAVHHISRNMPLLEELSVCDSERLSDGAVDDIASNLHNLQRLNLHQCQKVTDSVLKPLSKMKHLKYCNFKSTLITSTAYSMLPDCKVVLDESDSD